MSSHARASVLAIGERTNANGSKAFREAVLDSPKLRYCVPVWSTSVGGRRRADHLPDLHHRHRSGESRKDGVESIEAIRLLKHKHPNVQTTLGLSNISFGLNPVLEPERAGVTLSGELQLHPGQSTDAFVLHQPEANYFNV